MYVPIPNVAGVECTCTRCYKEMGVESTNTRCCMGIGAGGEVVHRYQILQGQVKYLYQMLQDGGRVYLYQLLQDMAGECT